MVSAIESPTCQAATPTSAMRIGMKIGAAGGIHTVETQIASVEDIFELQGVAAMKRAEKKYLR